MTITASSLLPHETKTDMELYLFFYQKKKKYKAYRRDREAEETTDDLKYNVVPKRYIICGLGANYLFA
jgi:hypothetical protein